MVVTHHAKDLEKSELEKQCWALETILLAPGYMGDREDSITTMQTRGIIIRAGIAGGKGTREMSQNRTWLRGQEGRRTQN